MTVAEQAGISHFNLVTLNWAPLATNDMLVPPPFDVKVGFTAGPSWLLYSEPYCWPTPLAGSWWRCDQ